MIVRDLIIGCSTNYDWSKLKYWINSINKSGFEGDKVMILMNCDKDTVDKVVESGFGVIGFNKDDDGNLSHSSNMPVHTERFIHIYNYLKDRDYRFVITTDVKDVVFQKNPIEYLEKECINKIKNFGIADPKEYQKNHRKKNGNEINERRRELYKLKKEMLKFNI